MDGHSAMAAMQDGRRSGRFPQNDTHGIEHVDRYPDTTGNWRARRAHSKHAPQLENDQRGRDDLPGVIHMLYRNIQNVGGWPPDGSQGLGIGHHPILRQGSGQFE